MVRPKRIDLPFSLYHVFSRTNTGDKAFLCNKDDDKFLYYLSKYCGIFDFKVHAWCFMPTHFHLLLESRERPALSDFMHHQLTAYTVFFNRYHGRHGHLFQGRFNSYIVDKTNYLVALSRYIHFNPVEAKMVDAAEDYRWSSMRCYRHGFEPAFLCTKEILSFFSGDRDEYVKFVHEGLTEETKPMVLQQSFVGDSDFAKRIRKRLKYMKMAGSNSSKAIAKQKERLLEKDSKKAEKIINTVADYFNLKPEIIKMSVRAKGKVGQARTVAIFLLGQHLPWTARKILKFMGLRSKRGICHYEKLTENNNNLRVIIEDADNNLINRK